MYPIFWLISIAIFAVVESITLGLYCVWFIAGSAAALMLSLLNFGLSAQLFTFLVVSGISLCLARPFFVEKIKKTITNEKTNLDLVLESQGVVQEEINNLRQTGTVKICGKIWTARTTGNVIIPEGVPVKPLRVEGVKLIVEELPLHTDIS